MMTFSLVSAINITVFDAFAAAIASASVSYFSSPIAATYAPSFTPYVPSPFAFGIKPAAQKPSEMLLLNVPPETSKLSLVAFPRPWKILHPDAVALLMNVPPLTLVMAV